MNVVGRAVQRIHDPRRRGVGRRTVGFGRPLIAEKGVTGVALEQVIADGPLQAVWDARISLPLEKGTAWVVSREGLVTLKTAAGRPQDLADVKRLLEIDAGGTDGGCDDA